MAYCQKCGAYIPDGQSVCLACGFDPEAKETDRRQENNWSAQVQEDYERLRREEQRRQEQERRQKQEEYRRQAQQEYDRRRQQEAHERQERQQAEPYAGHPYSARGQTNRSWGQSGDGTKLFSILSYISILFILPFIFCPNNKFARFHAKQGLVLFLFGIVADIFTGIFGLGILLSIFRIVCMVKGIVNAANGREEPLPYIGRFGL